MLSFQVIARPFRRVVGFLSLSVLFLTSCHKEPVEKVEPFLSDSSLVSVYEPSALALIQSTNDSLEYRPADYTMEVYRLTYRTSLAGGTPILASGIVYLPRQPKAKNYPLLSFQHATAYSPAEAPTGSSLTAPSFSYPLYFATHGYIVVCPDYLGYGQSSQVSHPYEHRETLAKASVDMLLATKEFLEAKNRTTNGQVFLAGYSEGGYATLSTQKMIQDSYATEFKLASTSCGSGPYATKAFFQHITTQPTIGKLANYLYVWQTLTYNELHGLNKPISYYFKAPYAEQIRQSMANARSITVSFHEMCTDTFRADVFDDTSMFSEALRKNDLTGWSTQTPLHLLHGDTDEYIPYLNTDKVYESMQKLGATQAQLTTIPNGYHVPTEVVFMRRTLEWFEKAKTKLVQ